MRAAMARTRRPRVYVANTSAAVGASVVVGRGAQPHPAQHRRAVVSGWARGCSATTVSISAGANSGRSCAIGRRRSITSNTRRSAASAKTAAARGGRCFADGAVPARRGGERTRGVAV